VVGRDVGREGLEPSSTGQLSFTPRMKEVLTQAVLEPRWLEHDIHIGTEHLLLGLSGQYDGVAARVLNEQGVTPGTIRKEIMAKISRGYSRGDQSETSGKTIEAWVGCQVRVAVENMGNGEPGRFMCTLEGVEARGISVSYESGTQRTTRFYSQHSIPYINLAKSEGAKQAPRRAGFTAT
jgi:ATP-dependent Clp protease ATP-binding subunit ClpA